MLIYELVDAIATLGGVHLQAGQPIAELVVGQCQVGTSPLAVVIALTTRVLGEGLGGARRTSVIRAGPALTVPSFACGRGGALANFFWAGLQAHCESWGPGARCAPVFGHRVNVAGRGRASEDFPDSKTCVAGRGRAIDSTIEAFVWSGRLATRILTSEWLRL